MKYIICDLANLFFRSRHGAQGDSFTKVGLSLHIIFRSLRSIYQETKADHIVFCCEGSSWRYAAYPQYKAKRKLDKLSKTQKEKDEDELFMEVLNDLTNFLSEKTRTTVLQSDGVEGDDFVARWIQNHPEDEHIILSGDSDFVQLLAPNVSIWDAVHDRKLTTEGVFKITNGEPMIYYVDSSSGKIKVPTTLKEAQKKAKKDGATFEFNPEPEYWKKALFVKIIRGDVGDGIFSAYPGVRYKGSSKKVGITEAWQDRKEKGFDWNNFMLQTWEKYTGKDENGEKITEDVRVLDEFRFNESLIDLTKQPDEIKELMDIVIEQAKQKEPVGQVGIHFLKFCDKHQLVSLSREANDHAKYLNRAYK